MIWLKQMKQLLSFKLHWEVVFFAGCARGQPHLLRTLEKLGVAESTPATRLVHRHANVTKVGQPLTLYLRDIIWPFQECKVASSRKPNPLRWNGETFRISNNMLHAHVVASLTFEIGLPQGVAGVDLQNYTTINNNNMDLSASSSC